MSPFVVRDITTYELGATCKVERSAISDVGGSCPMSRPTPPSRSSTGGKHFEADRTVAHFSRPHHQLPGALTRRGSFLKWFLVGPVRVGRYEFGDSHAPQIAHRNVVKDDLDRPIAEYGRTWPSCLFIELAGGSPSGCQDLAAEAVHGFATGVVSESPRGRRSQPNVAFEERW